MQLERPDLRDFILWLEKLEREDSNSKLIEINIKSLSKTSWWRASLIEPIEYNSSISSSVTLNKDDLRNYILFLYDLEDSGSETARLITVQGLRWWQERQKLERRSSSSVSYPKTAESRAKKIARMNKRIEQIEQRTSLFSKDFKGKFVSQGFAGSASGYARSVPEYATEDLHSLREWWHTILRNYDKYPCFAVFLVLPSDTEAATFLKESGDELNIISGRNCLILLLGTDFFYFTDLLKSSDPRISSGLWVGATTKHISQGESIQIAELFGIDLTEFPCVVFFNDIRSSDFAYYHFEISARKVLAKSYAVFSLS